jgi:large subunit ribosomal protein L21
MSYAVVRVGGKQYRVEEGQSIVVDRLPASEGDKVDLEPLLLADGDKSVLGGDELSKVKVQATVTGHERGKKIHGLKFKPKRGYKRRFGARADLTRLEISSIKSGGRSRQARGPRAGGAREPSNREEDDGS